MAKSVKLSDIAERMGVSVVTVSKALSGKNGVSEENRDKIKKLAEELGYRPVETKVSEDLSGNIGVIIPERYLEVGNSFYWLMYQHLVSRMKEFGKYTILEILNEDVEKNGIVPDILSDEKVDGAVILGQLDKEYTEIIWNKKGDKLVFLDFYDAHKEYDEVISDGFHGMYLLTSHFLAKGHRRIGFVGTPLATSSITDRYFGFLKALMESGIVLNEKWVIPDRETGSGDIIPLKLPEELPEVFVCNSDESAAALSAVLTEKGVDVGSDVHIGGFDNYLKSNSKQFRFTTYDVNIKKMTRLAAQTLIQKITGNDYIKGVQIVTGHLVVRD